LERRRGFFFVSFDAADEDEEAKDEEQKEFGGDVGLHDFNCLLNRGKVRKELGQGFCVVDQIVVRGFYTEINLRRDIRGHTYSKSLLKYIFQYLFCFKLIVLLLVYGLFCCLTNHPTFLSTPSLVADSVSVSNSIAVSRNSPPRPLSADNPPVHAALARPSSPPQSPQSSPPPTPADSHTHSDVLLTAPNPQNPTQGEAVET